MPMHRSTWSRTQWSIAVSLTISAATSLPAQVVQGTVRTTVTAGAAPGGAAVSGAVLTLLDSSGTSVGRALTGADGAFRIVAPRAGTYRVRTARIGFTPQLSAPLALAAGEVRALPLTLDFLALALDTLRVGAQAACRVERAEPGASAFQVWDQVRTALSATALTTAQRGLELTTVQFEREYAPTMTRGVRRIEREQRTVHREQARQPWRSAPLAQLRREGYVVEQADGSAVYYAPDLEGLLAPAFLEDHCLRVVAGRDSTEVGVAFEPTTARALLPEIAGTVYVARGSAALRAMTYRYVQVPPLRAQEAGGTLRFTGLRTGAWLISGWEIRMPLLERMDPRGAPRLSVVQASGGELVLARTGRDTVFAREPARFFGTVVDSVTRIPIDQARIVVAADTVRTDANGRFALPAQLPGVYAAVVGTPRLDSMQLAYRATLELIDSTSAIRIVVPPLASIVTQQCSIGPLASLLMGQVRRASDSLPLAIARITAEWDARPAAGSAPFAVGARMRLTAASDSMGAFRFCGEFAGAVVRVQAVTNTGRSTPVEVVVPTGNRAATVALLVDPRQSPVARLRGRVVADDSVGAPVRDAEVLLKGAPRGVRTDARGEFLLDTVPVGAQVVQVRRLGYTPAEASLTFRVGEDEEARFALGRVTVLDTVRLKGAAAIPSFEENRRLGLGQFVDRSQLEQMRNRTFSSILANMRGVRFRTGMGGSAWLTSGRGPKSISGATDIEVDGEDYVRGARRDCYARVIVDNRIIFAGRDREPLFDLRMIRPDDIESIEYYSGPSQTPSQYAGLGTNCGVLVLWTRRTFENSKVPSGKKP